MGKWRTRMKALILDGSTQTDGDLTPILGAVGDELARVGCQVRMLPLREMKIAPCVGCFGCWTRTPGVCTIADDGRVYPEAAVGSDLLVYFTPITFGGYSSELKKALDRSICLVLPFFTKIDGEVHHKPRYQRFPRLVGLGVLRQPDSEAERIFRTLVGRNAVNMHAPAYAAEALLVTECMERQREQVKSLLAQVGVGSMARGAQVARAAQMAQVEVTR
jgi:hypothetical protein